MALTRVAAAGINTGGTFVLENVNTSGIVTAGTVQVGAATTIHSGGIDLGGGNITSHNINSTGIITATGGFVGAVTGNVTGNLTGNVTGNVSSSGANTLGSLTVTNDATVGGALTITGDLTVNGTTTTIDTAVTAVDSLAIDGDASVGGALTATGNITANAFYGDGSNLTGIDATQIQTGNTNVQTVDTGSDGHVKVTTEGTERLRVTSDGDLVIKTSGTMPVGKFVFQEGSDDAFSFRTTGANGAFEIYDEWDNETRFHINTSGNIGIGTDNPAVNLEVRNTSPTLRVTGNSATNPTITLSSATITSWSQTVSGTDSSFSISRDGTERLRISSTGNVGIGTDNPQGTLSVGGNISLDVALGTIPSRGGITRHTNGYTYFAGKSDGSGAILTNGDGTATVRAESPGGSNGFLLFETGNGTERARITSSGNLILDAGGDAQDIQIISHSAASGHGQIYMRGNASGESSSIKLNHYGYADYVIAAGRSGNGLFSITGTDGGSDGIIIDTSGRLLVGTDTAVGNNILQLEGSASGDTEWAGISLRRGIASASLTSGQYLGAIAFQSQGGGEGAVIRGVVDSSWTSSNHPTRLIFATTEDGESSARERWRINNEGILTNQAGHHLHGSQDFINNYRCQFAVYASAESGTNGNSAVGTGPFDSTYLQADWNNRTLTYGSALELRTEYNLSQQSRAQIGAVFSAWSTSGSDGYFPTSGSGTSNWTPFASAIWARGQSNGGYGGYASVRADAQGYYGSSTAYYARVNYSPTSGRGFGYHCDLGGHIFGSSNVGYYVRQVDVQQQTGCTGFMYQRHNTNNTFNVLEVRNGSNTTIGSIRCTNSNTSFNTSSDYRLKENVTPVTNGIELIKQMPVKSFNFIGNAEQITGFLAHEIQDVAPYAVQGVKDGTKEVPAMDENDQPILSDEEVDGVKQPVMETVPDYQSVDYGKLTPILTAALQEAIAKIETLEAQNAELAARLDAAGL